MKHLSIIILFLFLTCEFALGTGGPGVFPNYVPPELTLNNDPIIHHSIGNDIIASLGRIGATAIDDCDGEITRKIVITGESDINWDIEGDYIITYTVSDLHKNVSTVTQTVSVKIIHSPIKLFFMSFFNNVLDIFS